MPLAEGKWRVEWTPVTAVAELEYLVYQRSESRSGYDFEQPTNRGPETYFVTTDLRQVNSQCFIVRALIKGAAADQNRKEVCTGHTAFGFKGIKSISPLDKGNYLISWEPGAYSSREMSYEVRERIRGQRTWTVAGTTSESFLASRMVTIGEVVCFNVRYIHATLKKDLNAAEICTDEENTGNFTGIKSIEPFPLEKGSYDISWEPSVRSDVIGYRIFKGVAMEDLLAEVPASASSYRVRGLGIAATFNFGVRIITKSGREDGNTKTLQVTVGNDKPLVETVKIQPVPRVNANGQTVRDVLECITSLRDPDKSNAYIFPKIEFKAQVTLGERPILLRKKIVSGPIKLDAEGKANFTSTYTLDPSKDRRGSDLYCEVTAFDGLDVSDPKKSDYISLPDTPPVATGMFISKRARYEQSMGTTHYYDATLGGDPGQVLSRMVQGKMVTENHRCMIAGVEGAVQNKDTLDICEDTSLSIVIKKTTIPTRLLEPGKESDLQSYRDRIAYRSGSLGDSYSAFFADSLNLAKTGYFDADDADIASRIETRNPKNGQVMLTRCLEGVCTINFTLAKDYNSGSDLGDKQTDGRPYPHAQLEYRVRTYQPADDINCSTIDGSSCATVGWSNWAPLQIEVTAVDEEPRNTGITVAGIEDRVQKIVLCNQLRVELSTAQNNADPDCSNEKTITLNPLFDPLLQDASNKYKAGEGYGYFDQEDDPLVRVLPDRQINPAIGEWVVPIVATPDPTNRAHWQALSNIPLTAADAANCDQTANDPTTGRPVYCPFHCDRALSKCYAYFMPATDVYSRQTLAYNSWVEVDPQKNPDPSFTGLMGKDREVRSNVPGPLYLDIASRNDPADVPSIMNTSWTEDEADGIKHELRFRQSLTPLLSTIATADYVPYYDPDIERLPDNSMDKSRTDMLRRAIDVEVRFLENGVYKNSYCASPSLFHTITNDYPGTIITDPNVCEFDTGPVYYYPTPPSSDAGKLTVARSKMVLRCTPLTADPNGRCDGEVIYPPNYNGVCSATDAAMPENAEKCIPNHRFEFRIQTTRLDNQGNVDVDANRDWAPWRQVDLTTIPVSDQPQTFTVSMGSLDSTKTPIKEDIPFTVTMSKGVGIGAVNLTINQGGNLVDLRYYQGYFDVDETEDVATRVIITSVSEFQAGSPVLLDKDGNALRGDDGLLLNSSATGLSNAFICDGEGTCTAEFRSAQNFFVPDGQPDPNFQFLVETRPKDPANRTLPVGQELLPERLQTSKTDFKGRFSFNIAPVDDAPGMVGTGGMALPEDTPTFFIVRRGGGGGLGYVEIEGADVAEKIEFSDIQFYDPAPIPTLVDELGVPNGMGYPDGLANAVGTTGPLIPVPAPVDRLSSGPLANRLIIRGETFIGSTITQVADSDVDTYKLAADAGAGLPERWQFSCRRQADAGLNTGDCWFEVRSPLNFNTGSGPTSASDPRPAPLRKASFSYRVFTRNPNLFNDTNEIGGSWSAWTPVAVGFDPVNDAPNWKGNFDLATMTRNNGGGPSDDNQTGVMSSSNPWRLEEDKEEYLEFRWGQHYLDQDYSTESYTFKKDFALDSSPPFYPTEMLYSASFLASKIAVFFPTVVPNVDPPIATTAFWGGSGLTYTISGSSDIRCPWGRRFRIGMESIDTCHLYDNQETIDNPETRFAVRSFLPSGVQAATMPTAGDTYTFVHDMNVPASAFGSWSVYDYTKNPAKLTDSARSSYFEIASSTLNSIVFRRKLNADSVVDANVTFELAFPIKSFTALAALSSVNDSFTFIHNLNQSFTGSSSWRAYDMDNGRYLTTIERDAVLQVQSSTYDAITILRIAPGYGPNFTFEVDMANQWFRSTAGEFYAPPAADGTASSRTNINCDSNGSCRLALIPPEQFFGNFRAQVRIADGSIQPNQKDWNLDSQKRDIYVRVDNVDDLPVVGSNDLVLDINEDYRYEFMFAPKSNAAFDANTLTYADVSTSPVWIKRELTSGCTGPNCTDNEFIIAPYFDPKAPLPWTFPQNYQQRTNGGKCYAQGNVGCGRFKQAFLLATVADVDREGPTQIAFDTLADTQRVSIFDPGTFPGCCMPRIPPSYFPDAASKVLRTSPFQYTAASYGSHAFFTLLSAPNFFTAKYRGQPSGRPYDYVMGPRGSGSSPWADPNNVDATGKGDLYFDYRIKTSDLGFQFTNTVDCSDPASCWSNQGRIYARIHPVDDIATVTNSIATKVPSQTDGVTLVDINVSQIVTSQEDDIITIEVNPSHYSDPDYNANAGEGRAIGIGQCRDTKDNPYLGEGNSYEGDYTFFNWSPLISYTVAQEEVFLSGARSDPLAGLHSMLRFDDLRGDPSNPPSTYSKSVSRGFVELSSGAPAYSELLQGGYLRSGASPTYNYSSTADASLASTCDFTVSGGKAIPTGTCRMNLRPIANLAGDFAVCIQVRTLPQAGDYVSPLALYSEKMWVKLRINDRDDPPHIGQLAVRARGNEDHIAEVEAVPRGFQWSRGATLAGAREGISVIAPGYWDFDTTAELIDETGLSGAALADARAQNAIVRDNYAEFMYINMAQSGTEFSGIGAGTIRYRSDPSLSRSNLANFDGTCQSGNLGFDNTDICRVPCESDGRCFFLFDPPADEPKAGGSTGRFSMEWWISQKGRLRLSSRPQDNTWSNRSSGGLAGVRLAATAGATQIDYDSAANAVNYDFTQSLACLSPVTYDLFGWRAAVLEEGEPNGIPGVFGKMAFSPLVTPTYLRPESQTPDPLRVVPDTALRNKTDIIHLYDYGDQPKPDYLIIDSAGPRCATSSIVGNRKVCSSTTALPPSGVTYLNFRNGAAPAGSVPCPGGETGRLALSVEPVSDKPEAKQVTRTVSGNHPTLLSFSQSLIADQDGYRDRDGDKPQSMYFLNAGQLIVGGITAGTFSISPTPPSSAQGMGLLNLVDDRGTPGDTSDDIRAIPAELAVSAPGCSVSQGDCSIWFHPNPGFNGTVNLDFTILTVGADGYSWESDRTGPDGPGRLTLNIRSSAPAITLFGTEPGEVLEDAVSGAVKVAGGGSNLSMIVDEDQSGNSVEDRDQVIVTFESDNILVIDPSKITFSCTDGAPGVATNLGACPGTINITPEPNAIANTPVNITIKATESGTGLQTTKVLPVKVIPVGDVPTIGTEPKALNSPANDYTTNEDTPLTISGVFIDEGGDADENSEVLSVSWTSSNPTVIPVSRIAMDISNEAVGGNNAGATSRSITITPAANQNSTTGVNITMTVSDGVSANTTRTFKVIVQPVNDPPLVTSGDPSTGSPYGVKQGEASTIGGAGTIRIDEGGAVTGSGSEDSQTLIWSFLSSDSSAINPATDVSLSGDADGTGDAQSTTRSLTISPSGFGNNITVTLRLSDDAGTTWVSYPFTVNVREAPGGTVACTSGGGAGNSEYIRGVGMPVTGITCSGVTAPTSTTGTFAWEIASVPESTCSGITINATTGVISGTMPIADCDIVVSANDTAAGANKTYLPHARRRTLKLLAASVTSVSFSNSPTLAPSCTLSIPVTTSYYLGRSSFASAAPTADGGVFTSLSASDISWTGQLNNFGAGSETVRLGITDTAGTNKNGQLALLLTTSAFPSFALPAPAALLSAASGEGVQAAFDFSKACSDATCASAPRAALAAGSEHSCVVTTASNSLYCFGNNATTEGRLGMGSTAAGIEGLPVNTGLTGVAALAIGTGHTCAITGAGASAQLKCFGNGSSGQLGLAAGSAAHQPSPVNALLPQQGSPLTSVAPAAVTAGNAHTCFLGQGSDASFGAGKVFCSGSNSVGQLGYATDSDSDTTLGFDTKSGVFQQVNGVAGAIAIASGSNHTCALVGTAGSRSILCWGSNSKHQLGELGRLDTANTAAAVTVNVTATNNAIGIAAGDNTTCALLADGSVRCWGDGAAGQLGDNTTTGTTGTATKPAVTPTGLDGLTPAGDPRKVVALAMGRQHSCALTTSRELWCFGSSSAGQLGIGSSPSALTPTKVTTSGGLGVVAAAAGDSHTCFVDANGSVWCMGDGDNGALGYISNAAPPIADRNVPTVVSGTSARLQQCLQTSLSVAP
jgi:alpha-tubulin suppressor-like RCC1 family protein